MDMGKPQKTPDELIAILRDQVRKAGQRWEKMHLGERTNLLVASGRFKNRMDSVAASEWTCKRYQTYGRPYPEAKTPCAHKVVSRSDKENLAIVLYGDPSKGVKIVTKN